MTVCGRRYAFAAASSCASTLAVNGRLPAEPGTTCNSYVRVHCTSGTDPAATLAICVSEYLYVRIYQRLVMNTYPLYIPYQSRMKKNVLAVGFQ